jgi:hypothetical protein
MLCRTCGERLEWSDEGNVWTHVTFTFPQPCLGMVGNKPGVQVPMIRNAVQVGTV